MDNELAQIREKVKGLLANFLGVEMEDIEDESTLVEDLHMKATDITDFMESLNTNGFDTTGFDLASIETFEDLIEALTAHA